MTNATTTKRARKATIKSRARRVKQTTTTVRMPTLIGWQEPAPLHIKNVHQQALLKRLIASCSRRERPVSIGVHGAKCRLSIFVLPRMSDVEDFVELNEVVQERDVQCTCCPVIMYTGAKA